MSIRYRVVVLVAAFLALAPIAAFAQNTTAGTSAFLTVGQTPVELSLDVATTQRWWNMVGVVGRSYCAEVTTLSILGTAYFQGNPVVNVFAADGVTIIASNNDITTEPFGLFQSRACWIDTTAGAAAVRYIQVTQIGALTRYYALRVTETTLWSSWFFVGGDYNSFVLMRNTTNAAISYTVEWRNAAGTVVGSSPTLSVPAHGGVGINAKTYITDPVTDFNGTVNIAHNGPPNGLVGQMTSLSSSTGLGFDAPLFARVPW